MPRARPRVLVRKLPRALSRSPFLGHDKIRSTAGPHVACARVPAKKPRSETLVPPSPPPGPHVVRACGRVPVAKLRSALAAPLAGAARSAASRVTGFPIPRRAVPELPQVRESARLPFRRPWAGAAATMQLASLLARNPGRHAGRSPSRPGAALRPVSLAGGRIDYDNLARRERRQRAGPCGDRREGPDRRHGGPALDAVHVKLDSILDEPGGRASGVGPDNLAIVP